MLDDLKDWLDKDPFVPFRIVVTSGGAFAGASGGIPIPFLRRFL